MAEINQQQTRDLRHGGHLKWQRSDPPRYSDGQKRDYMSIMKELWDQSGCSGLNISDQNLCNQAAYVERSLGNVAETIRVDTLARNTEQIEDRSECPAMGESFIQGNNYQGMVQRFLTMK